MAQVYQAIKAHDPFHIVIGAPWATPWALFAFGESVGALSMDYAQVENYLPDPASHLGDARIRAGMYFEPIANSPPSYLLEGAGGMPSEGPHVAGGKLWEPAPAQLESTLSWMGAMSFGAVNVVNFVIEPAPLKVVDTPDNITGALPGGLLWPPWPRPQSLPLRFLRPQMFEKAASFTRRLGSTMPAARRSWVQASMKRCLTSKCASFRRVGECA